MGKQLALFDLPEIWMEVRDHEYLTELIDDSPYTLREFSTRVGWRSHGYLNKLRAGTKKNVQPETAARMAKLLGVRIDRLFVTKESGDSAQTVGANSKTRPVKTTARRREEPAA